MTRRNLARRPSLRFPRRQCTHLSRPFSAVKFVEFPNDFVVTQQESHILSNSTRAPNKDTINVRKIIKNSMVIIRDRLRVMQCHTRLSLSLLSRRVLQDQRHAMRSNRNAVRDTEWRPYRRWAICMLLMTKCFAERVGEGEAGILSIFLTIRSANVYNYYRVIRVFFFFESQNKR